MHPAVGEKRTYRGQRYECTDAFPHVTRDGRNTILLVISSKCADCKQEFEITETSSNFRRRRLLRRCEYCRKPGVPVGPVRRKREKSISLIQWRMCQILTELATGQHNVVPDAQGWIRAKDWIRALIERGVFSKAEIAGKGVYYRMRRDLLQKQKIEKRGAAVRVVITHPQTV